ncbi:MotA/TolQ/ExbB proton channel family protein [Candidatus Dependentiae bacterium]|nr:MotA/TolQ/ExbB proton channel family protein [Candidatus Dependentiae bacterium]
MRDYFIYLKEYYFNSGIITFFLFLLSLTLTFLIILKYNFFRKINSVSINNIENIKFLSSDFSDCLKNKDKYLNIINTLVIIAPLLGLLGTVTGMITTFEIMTDSGTSNISAFAEGIKESLFTTEIGLIIAIPGYFFSRRLHKKAGALKNQVKL